MVYLTLGDLIVCSPEQGHPQRIHVHLEQKASDKCIIVFMNSDTKKRHFDVFQSDCSL